MKKLTAKALCLIISVAMLLCAFPAVGIATDTVKGDANGDGSVTVADARKILRIVIGFEKIPSGADIDMDSNSKINVMDARKVLRIANGLDTIPNPIVITEGDTDSGKLTASQVNALAETFTVEINVKGPVSSSTGEPIYTATGTGFFISADGKIATNYHVIENATEITVSEISGTTYECQQIIDYDDENDFAIIKVNASDHAFAKIGTEYATGDTIYTLGSSQGLSFTFSSGMISNAKRELKDYNPGFYYIQISAPISSGNSGGPLLDEYGNVIGINTLSYEEGQNLNFSIPASNLMSLDANDAVSAATYYNESAKGVYAAGLKLKETCIRYGSSGTASGVNYYTITTGSVLSSGYYSMTYYYDYDILEVSYYSSTRTGSIFTGTTTETEDVIYIDSKSVYEGYCVCQQTTRGSDAVTLVDAEYTIDGTKFKSGSTVTYESNEGTATNVSAYEKNSATAVTNMVTFLQSVITTYKLDITVADLGFKNF